MGEVEANYRRLMDRIAAAAARSGRRPEDIRLLAAIKSQKIETVREAVRCGVRLLGENYVQEAARKIEVIGGEVEWHMIGHLQRNKARLALRVFSVIESLDSVALARALNEEAEKQQRLCRVFVEVKLADEPRKAGVSRGELEPLLEEVAKLPRLRVEGLMAIPPYREDPEEVRPFFRTLARLRASVADLGLPNVEPRELSMGMTHDFEVAIEEGATLVRIGTGLFGPRS